MLISVSNLEYR